MGRLVLVRHGQSTWNAQNRFTGWRDPPLSAQGRAEAQRAGQHLARAGFRFDACFTSALLRAQESCTAILKALGQEALFCARTPALNERDYGALTGLNKDDARARWGAARVQSWRRSYEDAPPAGESLRDTGARVLPYYEAEIAPALRQRQSVLVVAHGNSLRALVMRLEGLDSQAIVAREIPTGAPLLYRLDANGRAARQCLP